MGDLLDHHLTLDRMVQALQAAGVVVFYGCVTPDNRVLPHVHTEDDGHVDVFTLSHDVALLAEVPEVQSAVCPHVESSDDGTSFCRLAEAARVDAERLAQVDAASDPAPDEFADWLTEWRERGPWLLRTGEVEMILAQVVIEGPETPA